MNELESEMLAALLAAQHADDYAVHVSRMCDAEGLATVPEHCARHAQFLHSKAERLRAAVIAKARAMNGVRV